MNPLFPDPTKGRNADDMGMPTPQPPAEPTKAQETVTPRTDCFLASAFNDYTTKFDGPLVNFARTLETELAAMTGELAQLNTILGNRGHDVVGAAREAMQDIAELRGELKDLKRSISCENMDPSGTIWDHADKVQKENAKLRDEVGRLKPDAQGDADFRQAIEEVLAKEAGDSDDDAVTVLVRVLNARDRDMKALSARLSAAQQDGDALAGALEEILRTPYQDIQMVVGAYGRGRAALKAHREGKKGGEST